MMHEGVRVLYVDDDAGIARLVQRGLERRGYSVECAPNGDAALRRIEEGGIEAVGLDHFMTGGTGLDVLEALKDRIDAPPVVYVTSSGDTGVAVAALKAGAADYVPKDVSGDFLDLLESAIDGAIEQARLRREKEAAEAAVREQRDRAEVLLREVNHRVSNSLSLVAALVRMQSSTLSDPGAVAALKETQARINAIAGIHRRLYTSDDVRVVEVGSYVKNLVAEMETAMRDEAQPPRIAVAVDEMNIPTDKAVSLGVIVTELLTNAFKYAYPGDRKGEIRLSLHRDADEARLVVEDDGVGRQVSGQAAGTGLGTQIVNAMAQTLRATIDHDPSHKGTRVVIRFPI